MSKEQAPKRWMRRAGWLAGLAAIPVLLFTVAMFVGGVPQAERQAWPTYQRVEAMGIPLGVRDFEARLRVAPEVNAAPELTQAAKAFADAIRRLSPDERAIAESASWARMGARTREEAAERAQSTLDKLRVELKAVREASRKPRFVPDRDWTVPHATLYPELAPLRNAARLKGLKAQAHALRGETRLAVAEIETQERLGWLVGDTPTLIPTLLHLSLQSIRCRTIEHCVALDPTRAEAYLATLNETRVRPFGHALKGESLVIVSIGRQLRMRDSIPITIPRTKVLRRLGAPLPDPVEAVRMWERTTNTPQEGLPGDLFARASIARLLQYLEPVLATLDEQGRERVPGTLGPAIRRMAEESEADRRISSLASIILLPLFLDAHQAHVGAVAQVRLTRAYVRVIQFRQSRGRWPANLLEAGVRAEDPFVPGSPLLFRLDGSGFRVWSVGKDLVDQNGRTRQEAGRESSAFDMVSVYPPPNMPIRVPR